MSEPIKIGGYGPDGCTCAITACSLCPVHGNGEEMTPHAFVPRSTADDEIWCVECEYHRDFTDAHPQKGPQ